MPNRFVSQGFDGVTIIPHDGVREPLLQGRSLKVAKAALKSVVDDIIARQNAGEEVEIGTHMIAGQLAREVFNLELEKDRT